MRFPEKRIFSIPNGARTAMSVAVRLKRTGLLSGVPDLFIPHAHGGYFGFFIEIKSKTGRISDEQSDFLHFLGGQKYRVACFNTFEDFAKNVAEYLSGQPTAGLL